MQLVNNFMTSMVVRLMALKTRDEEGQTLVEYGLIVALLSIAAIAILGILGDDITAVFTDVSNELQSATTP